jgi:hypothetical protein
MIFVLHLYGFDWLFTLEKLGVPRDFLLQADLNSVLAAWECVRKGVDPFYSNPCDPVDNVINYPKIWQSFSMLGLGQQDLPWLAILQTLLFFAAALVIIDLNNWQATIIYALSLLSSGSLLALKTGNVDLIIFTLSVLAVIVFYKGFHLAAFLLIILLAFLKLYPVALLGLFLLPALGKRQLIWIVSGTLLFAVYILINYHDIRLIGERAPRLTTMSFGSLVYAKYLYNQYINNGELPRYIGLAINGFMLLSILFVVARSLLLPNFASRLIMTMELETGCTNDFVQY